MSNKIILLVMCIIVSLCVVSCSGGKATKGIKDQGAPAQMEKQGNGGEKPLAESRAVAVSTVIKKTPAELLAAIPCKMQGKKGVFAVFPENNMAGQICFKLNSVRGDEQSIPFFDIKSGGIYIIFHDNTAVESGELSLVKWESRNEAPCIDVGCGKEIAVRRESYISPDEPGWTYVIVTPEKPVDFTTVSDTYIGLTAGSEKYLPLFQ